MDSLNIGVKVDAGAAAESLNKVGASIDGVTAKTKLLTATSNDNLAAAVKQEAAIQRAYKEMENYSSRIGKTKSDLMAMKAEQMGITDKVQGFIDTVKKFEASQIKEGAHSMEEFGFQTAGAKRELLVLAHELSQGNFKRFAGSLMVLGERTNAMGSVFAMATSPIALAGAALAVFAGAAVEGAMEVSALQKSMQLTNGYAGVTVAGFDAMAESIAHMSDGRIGVARDALQALVATGRFGADNLQALGVAAVNMERVTGQTAEEVVKDFEKMADGVAAWVAEHNKSMHFVTLAQYDYIKAMEDAGNKEGAEAEATRLMNAQLGVAESRLGALEKGWIAVKNAASAFWDGAKSIGRNDETEKLQSALSYQRSQFARAQALGDKGGMNGWNSKMIQTQKQLDLLNEVAAAKGRADKVQEDGLSAEKKLDEWRKLAGSINLAKKEIDDFRVSVAQALAANPNNADALDAQKNAKKIEEAIRKKYNKSDYKAENKLTSAFTSSKDSMGADNAKMEDEIRQIAEYGKAVDKSRVAILEFELTKGKLKGLDSWRASQLRGLAGAGDADAEKLAGVKGVADLDKKLAALKAEAEAQAVVKEATREAALMADLDQQKSRISAETYAAEAAKIHSVTQELEKHNSETSIATLNRTTDDQVTKIIAEANATSQSALEHQKLAAALKIQAQANADIAKSPGQAGAIQAAAASDINKLGDAYDYADQKRRSFTEGWQNDTANYLSSISDGAAQSKKVFTDMFKGMEDALFNFVTTGKLSFSSLAKSIIDDLIRISIQKGITGPLANSSAGGGVGGMFGGLLGGIFGPGVSVSSTADGATGIGSASGAGYSPAADSNAASIAMEDVSSFAVGTDYVPQDMLAMIHKGEKITPAAFNSTNGDGAGHTVNVTVNHNGDSSGDGAANVQQFGQMVGLQIRQTLLQEKRPGGLLA